MNVTLVDTYSSGKPVNWLFIGHCLHHSHLFGIARVVIVARCFMIFNMATAELVNFARQNVACFAFSFPLSLSLSLLLLLSVCLPA